MSGLNVVLILMFLVKTTFVSSQSSGQDCKEHFTNGYGYRLFFNLPQKSFQKDGTLVFKFSLSAPSNGHILLSEKPNSSPGYEVVLGAGRNDFSEIRKYENNRPTSKSSALTKNILSFSELRNFTIIVNRSIIAVVNKNQNLNFGPSTFLYWADPMPLDVKYVSFCGWTGVTVRWLYDCQGVDLTPTPVKLSNMKFLKKLLLNDYDPYAIPATDDNVLTINAGIDLAYVNLDAKKSIMTTHGQFKFTWIDPKLRWTPKEHENIDSFNLIHRQIWLPEFVLFNSYDLSSSPMGKGLVTVHSNGSVRWSPKALLVTWCTLDLRNWPFDEQSCNMSLGLPAHPNSVYVSLDNKHIKPSLDLKSIEWKVTKMFGETNIVFDPWHVNSETFDDDDRRTTFLITLTLKRQAKPQVYSFILPLGVTALVTFTTMWLPPMCPKRIFLLSVSLIILILNLIALAECLPALPTSTPHLLSVTSNLSFFVSVQIIFSGLLMSVTAFYKYAPPKIVSRIVTNPLIQMTFLLSQEIGEDDAALISSEQDLSPKQSIHWKLFSTLLDRIMFLISLVCVPLIVIF